MLADRGPRNRGTAAGTISWAISWVEKPIRFANLLPRIARAVRLLLSNRGEFRRYSVRSTGRIQFSTVRGDGGSSPGRSRTAELALAHLISCSASTRSICGRL